MDLVTDQYLTTHHIAYLPHYGLQCDVLAIFIPPFASPSRGGSLHPRKAGLVDPLPNGINIVSKYQHIAHTLSLTLCA
jgi:hypothetical protein